MSSQHKTLMTPKEYLAAERLAAEALETIFYSSAGFTRSIFSGAKWLASGYNQC